MAWQRLIKVSVSLCLLWRLLLKVRWINQLGNRLFVMTIYRLVHVVFSSLKFSRLPHAQQNEYIPHNVHLLFIYVMSFLEASRISSPYEVCWGLYTHWLKNVPVFIQAISSLPPFLMSMWLSTVSMHQQLVMLRSRWLWIKTHTVYWHTHIVYCHTYTVYCYVTYVYLLQVPRLTK